MQTPPPLPKPQRGPTPPPLPRSIDVRRPGPATDVVDDYLELRRRCFWFVPVILVGVPAGLLRQAWIEALHGDPDARLFLAFMAVVGGLGLIAIFGFMLYLLRHPETRSLAGLRRSYWLMGLPSAWCLGVVTGFVWQYL